MFSNLLVSPGKRHCENILVPRRRCLRELTSLTSPFISGVFQTQAELCSPESAHVLIAIGVPFNRKMIHQWRNAPFPTHCHGPMGLKQRLSNQFPDLRKVTLNYGSPTGGNSVHQEASGNVWKHLGLSQLWGGHPWHVVR